jgi:flavin reductase (DIM6/NTAB) family NADH-FMN oxidoreductase RutF
MEPIEIRPKILYYGTPVALVCSQNEDGSFNLAPMSSSWALGYTIVLGFSSTSQTSTNLQANRELTVNFPAPELMPAVERLAPLTARTPVPEAKRAQFRSERRKFEAAGLTPVASVEVAPPRVAECALQLEAVVTQIDRLADEAMDGIVVQARVLRVHAHRSVVEGESHIDVDRWHPLLYVYRHYFGRGAHLGSTFRAETKREAVAGVAP